MKNKIITLFFSAAFAWSSFIFANPQNPTVVAGDVKIDDSLNNILQIHANDKSIINWKDFSIDIGEITKFIQPDKASAVLNRVLGEDASNILGKLEANGHVFLINPNGIIFGKDADIDTAAFTASTLNLLDEDFLKKSNLLFEGSSKAAVINLGKINTTCGDVTLLGYKVENHGEINCQNGIAALGVGRKILIKPSEEEKIYICLQEQEEEKEEEGLVNTGKIKAVSAELKADGNPYMYAINLDGVIEANGFEEKEGKVFIVAEEGRAEVSGEIYANNSDTIGGEVRLLGKEVGLLDKAKIDVSAKNKGGVVLIGGDYKGQNPEILNAKAVFISPKSIIDASAIEKGNGGKIIVWSDDSTRFYGKALAKGGSVLGDGGLVETSSKGFLETKGSVETLALKGNTGTWLLDPCDITIVVGPIGGSVPVYVPPNYTPAAAAASLTNGDLQSGLAANNVIIDSSGGPVGPNGDIIVNAVVTWNSSFSLTLQSNRNITMAPLSALQCVAPGTGDINFIANNPTGYVFVSSSNNINTNGGNISCISDQGLSHRGTMNALNGTISISTPNGDINIGNGVDGGTVTAGGTITLLANIGNVNVFAGAQMAFVASATGDVIIDAGTNVNMIGGFIPDNNMQASIQTNGQVLIGNTIPPQNLNMTGGTAQNAGAIINIADVTINVVNDVNLDARPGGASSVAFINARTITLNANNVNLWGGNDFGGTNGAIMSAYSGAADINVVNNLTLEGGNNAINNFALIQGNNPLNLNVGGDILLLGNGTSQAIIQSAGGAANIQTPNNITMNGYTSLLSVVGDLRVIAGDNINLISNAAGSPSIATSGTGLYIVVDNNFPNSPDIGPGSLNMDATSTISTIGGAPIYIFTAIRDQNVINGLIQGISFAPGTEYVDSATEAWGRYYADVIGGVPYTIFYKNFGLFDLAMEHGGAALAELYRLLHGYGEYIDAYTQFYTRYEGKSKANVNTLDSFDVPYKKGFYLRKRTEPNEERITEEL